MVAGFLRKVYPFVMALLVALFLYTIWNTVSSYAASLNSDNNAQRWVNVAKTAIPIPSSSLSLKRIDVSGYTPAPDEYKRIVEIPDIGEPAGIYSGEFHSSNKPNQTVDPALLPGRPFIGTELYWIKDFTTIRGFRERSWLRELKFDFVRIQVTPAEVGKGNTPDYPYTDFRNWRASDFEYGHTGWRFNDDAATVTNLLENITMVKFPLMMMMHYGGEDYMGHLPASDEYAEYFLATVYYYNVIRGLNIRYWEVLNEPDWGWNGVYCSPKCYAEIFRKVVERIRSFPDKRVNSILLGGPALGSGDPIDGKWPNGYANQNRDGNRKWRQYIPTLMEEGSRDGQQDVGFISWHDYGESWGLPNNILNLDQNYAVINRVEAMDKLLNKYNLSGEAKPQLAVTEMNFDAGKPNGSAAENYKNFYAALWHTSTLNNYLSTGKLSMLSVFYWRGSEQLPKGLLYSGSDSNNKLVRNPVWWAYREYMVHTQSRILAAYNGKQNRWADAIITTDPTGKMLYMIAVNKSDKPQTLNFSFDVPEKLFGPVVVSKRMMQAGGEGKYGEPFHQPVITNVYRYQHTTFEKDQQVEYRETIPPHTVLYYTIVRVK